MLFNKMRLFSKNSCCNDLLDRMILISETINSVEDFRFDILKFKTGFVKASQFSVPGIEFSAFDILDKVFPNTINRIVDSKVGITAFDVKEKDKEIVMAMVNNLDSDQNRIDAKCLLTVLEHIYSKIRIKGIKPFKKLSFYESIDLLPKSTSSGFPFYGKKGDIEIVEGTKVMFERYFSGDIKLTHLWQYPVTIFHRFVTSLKESGDFIKKNTKIRQIQGVPFLILALEVHFFKSFKDRFLETFKNIACIGYTRVQISSLVKKVRGNSKTMGKRILCGDLSNCDVSISKFLMTIFYSFSSEFLTKEEFFRSIPLIYWIVKTPIMLNQQIVITNGSNPTGMWFTSLLNTFSLIVVLNYFSVIKNGKILNEFEYLVQGDDFIILIDEGDEKLLKTIFKIFNFRLNLNKSKVVGYKDDISFLGFEWDYNSEPDNDDLWLIARTLYPERFVDFAGPERLIVRYLSLLFQIKRSYSLFVKFMSVDKELKDRVLNKSNVTFKVLTSDGRLIDNKVPINRFLEIGWRMF